MPPPPTSPLTQQALLTAVTTLAQMISLTSLDKEFLSQFLSSALRLALCNPLLVTPRYTSPGRPPWRSERLHPPRAHQALAANTSRREPPLLTMAGWASEGRGAGPCRSEGSAWTLPTYHSTRHHRYTGSAPNNTR
ncbi:uncharacterized protein LOC125032410 [Penaeus chinensis]|uniref:uncharacterized protein LOC125032410 n=1 Tax=Penaeus chinensis TaxID=139456 RepID=UPI001FB6D08A|nr:uncharacterized protein LOC125032410 [Penaeus chinensis]